MWPNQTVAAVFLDCLYPCRGIVSGSSYWNPGPLYTAYDNAEKYCDSFLILRAAPGCYLMIWYTTWLMAMSLRTSRLHCFSKTAGDSETQWFQSKTTIDTTEPQLVSLEGKSRCHFYKPCAIPCTGWPAFTSLPITLPYPHWKIHASSQQRARMIKHSDSNSGNGGWSAVASSLCERACVGRPGWQFSCLFSVFLLKMASALPHKDSETEWK